MAANRRTDQLGEYRAKRRPERSREPSGSDARRSSDSRFVIQRHDASSLHFDLRPEIDGVLVSWAVPKGPSTNPSDKRLARTQPESALSGRRSVDL